MIIGDHANLQNMASSTAQHVGTRPLRVVFAFKKARDTRSGAAALESKTVRLDAERQTYGWRCSLRERGRNEMIDPPAQNGMMNFAGRRDDRNFGYCNRNGGTMLANSLSHTVRLGGFLRSFGMIVVL